MEHPQIKQHRLPLFGQIRRRQCGTQGVGLGVLLRLFFAEILGHLRPWPFGADVHQPIPQILGRDAINAVVILDLVQNVLLAGLQPFLIGHDRTTGGFHLAVAHKAVKRFHGFDRVIRLGTNQPAPHHGKQIDKPPFAQQTVKKGLAHTVFCRQTAQGGDFIGGVVVNAGLRELHKARAKEIKQVNDGLFFRRVIMRPEGHKAGIFGPDPVQIF